MTEKSTVDLKTFRVKKSHPLTRRVGLRVSCPRGGVVSTRGSTPGGQVVYEHGPRSSSSLSGERLTDLRPLTSVYPALKVRVKREDILPLLSWVVDLYNNPTFFYFFVNRGTDREYS